MLFSFFAPTVIVIGGAVILGAIATLIARRGGPGVGIATYFIGAAICFWFGPILWADISMALRAVDEPLAPTGRALSTGLYGFLGTLTAYGTTCAILAVLRARPK